MPDTASGRPLLSTGTYSLLLITSVIVGALATLAFAPYNQVWLVFVSQAIIFTLWQQLTPVKAWLSGWLYGVGLQFSGVSWIYYSLHVHGGTPTPFAIMLVFLLACYLGIYTGFTAYIVTRFCPPKPVLRLLFFYPAAWVVFEWLQGYVLTGFAWMQTGYTQIDSPLAGYAPLLGNHGVGGLVAMSAGALALLCSQFYAFFKHNNLVWQKSVYAVLLIALIWFVGILLKPINWTQPHGKPIKISLIQGDVPQSLKWSSAMYQPTLDRYRKLTLKQNKNVDLIVWPETAVPNLSSHVQPFIHEMKLAMQTRGTDLMFGIFVRNQAGQLLNSVLNINGEIYSKRHLVPLGEYIPLRFLVDFFRRWVNIPMSDLASGNNRQPLMYAAGIPVGVSICFEEAFARDILIGLPQVQLLVNVSNDAWFEHSQEPYQHLAIARMRALESGRYMIRSTNTGVSAIIGPHGDIIKQAPLFKIATLSGRVQPLIGSTPYVIWGDYLILLICGSILAFGIVSVYTLRK